MAIGTKPPGGPWLAYAAIAVLASAATYALDRPAHDEAEYDRVLSTASNHERCLRDIGSADESPDTLAKARSEIHRVKAQADDCFHGRRW